MAKFNTGKIYNSFNVSEGALYNGATFRIIVKVYDAFKMYEKDIKNVAKIVFSEKLNLQDFMEQFVFHNPKDKFELNDSVYQIALFDFMEKVNLSDIFSELVVSLRIADKSSVLDELGKVNAIVSKNENALMNEITSVSALLDIAEKYGFEEAYKALAFIEKYESLGMTDREPRKAISDFILGQIDGKDNAYDWIAPFDMKVDWKSTNIQVMPTTESTYIDIPGKDGSIVEDTVYKNRIFSIVAFSEQGLSVYEKEQLKRDIVQILDSTKKKPKKMTLQASSTCFDVKYSGSAVIESAPSFIKATIPFETSPYGYPLFDREVIGTGLIINDGDKETGCVHTISSGCVNPSFQLGSITYKFDGTVPEDTKLIINHNDYSCYFETVKGTRTNAIDKLTGEFQTIPAHSSMAITAIGDTAKYISTTIREEVLW